MNNFLRTINGDSHEVIPVWFMRQAGRYMKIYQEIRKNNTIKDICMNPELTEKITYEPVKVLNVDAAIIFADIILPLEAMGYNIDFLDSGPAISNGYSNNHEMHGIHEFSIKDLRYRTEESIKLFKKMHPETPLIGFSGGIITVLSYLFSGGHDNNLEFTKKVMGSDPKFSEYKTLIKDMIIKYLKMQINAGVDAIQIFDSWLGSLSPYYFERYIKSDIIDIVQEIGGSVPLIYFSTGNSGMIEQFNDINPDFLSVDWRIQLSTAGQILNDDIGLQGNLDPATVQYSYENAMNETSYILNQKFNHDNYIFNLGHGVLPATKIDTLKNIVDTVHKFKI